MTPPSPALSTYAALALTLCSLSKDTNRSDAPAPPAPPNPPDDPAVPEAPPAGPLLSSPSLQALTSSSAIQVKHVSRINPHLQQVRHTQASAPSRLDSLHVLKGEIHTLRPKQAQLRSAWQP